MSTMSEHYSLITTFGGFHVDELLNFNEEFVSKDRVQICTTNSQPLAKDDCLMLFL